MFLNMTRFGSERGDEEKGNLTPSVLFIGFGHYSITDGKTLPKKERLSRNFLDIRKAKRR